MIAISLSPNNNLSVINDEALVIESFALTESFDEDKYYGLVRSNQLCHRIYNPRLSSISELSGGSIRLALDAGGIVAIDRVNKSLISPLINHSGGK